MLELSYPSGVLGGQSDASTFNRDPLSSIFAAPIPLPRMTSPYADVSGEDIKTIVLFFNSVSHLLPLQILSDGSLVLLRTRNRPRAYFPLFLVFIPPSAACVHHKIRRPHWKILFSASPPTHATIERVLDLMYCGVPGQRSTERTQNVPACHRPLRCLRTGGQVLCSIPRPSPNLPRSLGSVVSSCHTALYRSMTFSTIASHRVRGVNRRLRFQNICSE